NKVQATGVRRIRGLVGDVAVEVGVAGVEAQRVLAGPSPYLGVVVALVVVLQQRLEVVLAPRVLVAVPERRVRLAHHGPDAVVPENVPPRPRVVGQVADRALPVGQIPRSGAGGVEAGQELVGDIAAEIPSYQRAAAVQVYPDVPVLVPHEARPLPGGV